MTGAGGYLKTCIQTVAGRLKEPGNAIGVTRRAAAAKSLGILAVYIGIPLCVLSVGLLAIGAENSSDMPAALKNVLSVIGYITAIALIIRRYRKRGVTFSEAAGLNFGFFSKSNIRKILLTVLAGVLAGLATAALLSLLPEGARRAYDEASVMAFGEDAYALAVLIAMLFSPISEEIVFRGILYGSMRRGFGSFPAALMVSALFAALHVHPLWVMYAFGFGLLFSFITIREGGIAAAVTAHFGVNLSSVPSLFMRETGQTPSGLGFAVLMVAMLALCGAGAAFIFRKVYFSAGERFSNG